MKKVLLVGPSGVGKSYCVKNKASKFTAMDMDQSINTRAEFCPKALMEVLEKSTADLIAVSVISSFLRYLLEQKSCSSLLNNYHVVYLKTTAQEKHKARLKSKPAIGDYRSDDAIKVMIKSVDKIDLICAELADEIINVDTTKSKEVVNKVNSILEATKECSVESLNFLTRSEYDHVGKKIGGAHWASAGSRWEYHKLAGDWAKTLKIDSPDKVLELGTMGMTIVNDSHTLDYDAAANNKDWFIDGYNPTITHDLRVTPWPIPDQEYDLLIALRVFHHVKPMQKECFLEAKRIAKSFILVVPAADIHPRGISRDDLVSWNDGIVPDREIRHDGNLGSSYFWDWSK